MEQQIHGYIAASNTVVFQKPALPVSNPRSDGENDSGDKYFKASRRAGLETEGRVLLFLGKVSSGTWEREIP